MKFQNISMFLLGIYIFFAGSYAIADDNHDVELQIKLTSIFVEDQLQALDFYTNTLGFEKKADIPLGKFKWLTVTSSIDRDGTELVLEPNTNPAARTFQSSMKKQGIPATAFEVGDIQKTYTKLKNKGVKFTQTPTPIGNVTSAVLDDTCGNLIQIYENTK